MIDRFASRAAVYLEADENRRQIQKYVDIYLSMMQLLQSGDVSENAQFHRLYNVFYKLRFSGGNGRTSGETYAAYYRLIETHKQDAEKPPVEQVLRELWDLRARFTYRFQAS